MRYFARLSSAKTRWPDDRDPVTDDMRVKARKDFARRPNDDDGVSIFEVCSARRGDLERVVAAAVLQRTSGRDGKVVILVFTEDDIAGRTVEPTPQHCGSCVEGIPATHHSLNWDQDTLDGFADNLLAAQRTVEVFTAAQVQQVLLKLTRAELTSGVDGDSAWAWLNANREKWAQRASDAARKAAQAAARTAENSPHGDKTTAPGPPGGVGRSGARASLQAQPSITRVAEEVTHSPRRLDEAAVAPRDNKADAVMPPESRTTQHDHRSGRVAADANEQEGLARKIVWAITIVLVVLTATLFAARAIRCG